MLLAKGTGCRCRKGNDAGGESRVVVVVAADSTRALQMQRTFS